jgi:cold shock CspA family protein
MISETSFGLVCHLTERGGKVDMGDRKELQFDNCDVAPGDELEKGSLVRVSTTADGRVCGVRLPRPDELPAVCPVVALPVHTFSAFFRMHVALTAVERMQVRTGKVDMFDEEKGFGFVKPELQPGRQPSAYFRRSDVDGSSRQYLQLGLAVRFLAVPLGRSLRVARMCCADMPPWTEGLGAVGGGDGDVAGAGAGTGAGAGAGTGAGAGAGAGAGGGAGGGAAGGAGSPLRRTVDLEPFALWKVAELSDADAAAELFFSSANDKAAMKFLARVGVRKGSSDRDAFAADASAFSAAVLAIQSSRTYDTNVTCLLQQLVPEQSAACTFHGLVRDWIDKLDLSVEVGTLTTLDDLWRVIPEYKNFVVSVGRTLLLLARVYCLLLVRLPTRTTWQALLGVKKALAAFSEDFIVPEMGPCDDEDDDDRVKPTSAWDRTRQLQRCIATLVRRFDDARAASAPPSASVAGATGGGGGGGVAVAVRQEQRKSCRGLSWTVVDCRGLSWTVVDLSWTVVNCCGLLWTVVDCRELS